MPTLEEKASRRSLGTVGASKSKPKSDPLFGFKVRDKLYSGEADYFKNNPKVTGIASETNEIIINPYSDPGVNVEAVKRNEAFRLLLRKRGSVPEFEPTPEQRQSFRGTEYLTDEDALRSTLAARIYSEDPSARATVDQREWVRKFLETMPEPK